MWDILNFENTKEFESGEDRALQNFNYFNWKSYSTQMKLLELDRQVQE